MSSRMGPTACFLLDSLSYLAAAWFAWQLQARPSPVLLAPAAAHACMQVPAKHTGNCCIAMTGVAQAPRLQLKRVVSQPDAPAAMSPDGDLPLWPGIV